MTSLQSSLYVRLRGRYGAGAGRIAWALVRLAQPAHAAHVTSRETLAAAGGTARGELRGHVERSRGAARGAGADEWRRMCDVILAALDVIRADALVAQTTKTYIGEGWDEVRAADQARKDVRGA